jgi:type II secretory pathway component PulF
MSPKCALAEPPFEAELSRKPGTRRESTTKPRRAKAKSTNKPKLERRGITRSRITRSDVLMVTSQLAVMCQTGLDLAEAIRVAASACRHPGMKRILTSVYDDISAGVKPSLALEKHGGRELGGAYVASIAAAEASGTVTEVLQRLAEMLRNEIRMRSGIMAAISYPAILLGVAFVVVNALIFFVLPQFSKVFEQMGRPAPPLTRLLLDGSTFIRSYWVVVLLAVAVMTVGATQLWRMPAVRRYIDWFVLHGVLIKSATRSLYSGRTFRLIGTLLQSGVPLLDAVRLCRGSIKNSLFKQFFDRIESDVVSGKGLAGAVGEAEFVPLGASQMLATAERTGKLGHVLGLIGEHFEDEGEQKLRQIVRLAEPAVIVFLGGIVGMVVLAVILPLLDISSVRQ